MYVLCVLSARSAVALHSNGPAVIAAGDRAVQRAADWLGLLSAALTSRHGDACISLAREVLKAVPRTQREGAYALGATQWEAIRVALAYGRTGIVGAIMLGFGRALGETMAVTMVIGNNPNVSWSLFAPQYTMAAVIANEFTEATDGLHLHALIEIGLVLFIITLAVNALSRMLIWSMNRQTTSKPRAKAEPALLGDAA